MPITKEKRADINRRNAQKSTGPKTQEGKDRVRLNACRHNITGQTMVMFPKDLDVYFQHKDEYFAFYNPVGPVEKQVVQNIADSSWKVNLCTALQTRIISGQSMHHLHKYPETNHPEASEALATGEAVTDGGLTKQLANLSLYEQRYRRIYERPARKSRNCRAHAKLRKRPPATMPKP